MTAARLGRALDRLRRERSGIAMMEFALAFPLVLAMGGYGIEISSFALCNLRVSQYALNLADHASRVGIDAGSGTTQFREADAVDVLQGAKLQGKAIDLTGNGRVTLSSLEADANGNQTIHWQRCIGQQAGAGYDSSYGITATNNRSNGTTYDPTAGRNTAGSGSSDNSASHPGSSAVGTTANPGVGMGDANAMVIAPNNGGVMFVEINYLYKPVFGSLYFGSAPRIIHYVASFIVRDNRTFTQVFNPEPKSPVMTCDLHTA